MPITLESLHARLKTIDEQLGKAQIALYTLMGARQTTQQLIKEFEESPPPKEG